MRQTFSILLTLFLSAQVQAAIQANIEPTTLNMSEDGSTVTYRVYLDQAPSAGETVTVTGSSSDVTEGTVGPAVTFTESDWDIPKTISVTPGASGDGNDGDVTFTITNTVTAAGGTASFNGAPAANVSATNRNVDGVNTIVMNPASGAAFYLEEGESQTVTVSAEGVSAPTNDISIDISIAGAEATVSTGTVTLNAGNAYSASFDVTASIDAVVDGDQAFTVVTAAAVSADAAYNGINLDDIAGLAIDIDVVAPPTPQAVPTLPAAFLLMLSGLILALGLRKGVFAR